MVKCVQLVGGCVITQPRFLAVRFESLSLQRLKSTDLDIFTFFSTAESQSMGLFLQGRQVTLVKSTRWITRLRPAPQAVTTSNPTTPVIQPCLKAVTALSLPLPAKQLLKMTLTSSCLGAAKNPPLTKSPIQVKELTDKMNL